LPPKISSSWGWRVAVVWSILADAMVRVSGETPLNEKTGQDELGTLPNARFQAYTRAPCRSFLVTLTWIDAPASWPVMAW
jgi:hypothetical protein